MISLFDILEYITAGPTLLLFGAGPSCELGLPDWKSLAKTFLAGLKHSEKTTSIINQIEDSIKHDKLPTAFQIIASAMGYGTMYEKCRALLKDPGASAKAYTALAQLPFHGYLTTNYDDIFLRHLKANRKVATVHKNSRHEIEQVDFDAVPTLVKLHSDLENTETIILTENQYKIA